MPEILKAIFWTAAVICFAVGVWREQTNRHEHVLLYLGLALFVIPFAFDAWAVVD